MLREVEYNETVSRCVRPLHRVCPGDRVRREQSEESEESSEESSEEREESSEESEESSEESQESSEESSEESKEIHISSEGPSCKYYNETVCIKKGTDTNENSDYKEECQLLEVKQVKFYFSAKLIQLLCSC